ncbi:hypothetical protein CONPUDRAFT_87965 [Coniophora puteana RWD-64-598 SS2]|uniref:Uncharacterized protein n=1 Tax=Coniophora puteana (strain RWD-64-598) TaxID=741705 RepID=A0A5M3N2L3_CONPW|nr:uncharacterized protein CONPUDRAFT_87965 [Coniophora puteana RWD-64-598 SS2]EIW85556.1 hypothetical protein CONPUDRAFT_87965 [Coniophora puteana RWD-64-598 SS2]
MTQLQPPRTTLLTPSKSECYGLGKGIVPDGRSRPTRAASQSDMSRTIERKRTARVALTVQDLLRTPEPQASDADVEWRAVGGTDGAEPLLGQSLC